MKSGTAQIRSTNRARQASGARWIAEDPHGGAGFREETNGDVTMQPEARSWRVEAVQAHPLAELLECPAETGNLLNGAAQCFDFASGDIVFRQSENCQGLYVVVSGQFQRRAERMESRLTLSPARTGDLVELAAVLGDGRHTYTMSALTAGSVLMLPREALSQAFQNYPVLRMRLLEELAREVSRAYNACCQSRTARVRRRGTETSLA
ncbi:MAG: Crp/Fnr family transcriptional regulator [Terracidiphilus sp.]